MRLTGALFASLPTDVLISGCAAMRMLSNTVNALFFLEEKENLFFFIQT